MAMHLKVGADAPEFVLSDDSGRKVALSDFRGEWVVLYFYPKDDTPGCTTEACEFTAGLPAFGRLDAKVLGISPDSPETHGSFAAKFHLKHVLLSDPDHEVTEIYGAWAEKSARGEKAMGVVRSTWLVSPEGKLSFYWPEVTAAGHAEEVRAKLDEIKRYGRRAA